MPLSERGWDRWMAAEHRPLSLKMCAGCTAQYAVEGDAGDEQGGTPWFGPCCGTPEKYADVFIREASARHSRQPLWYRRTRCWYCRGRSFGGPLYMQLADLYAETWPAPEAA